MNSELEIVFTQDPAIVGAGFIGVEITFTHLARVREIFLTHVLPNGFLTIVQQPGSFRVISLPPPSKTRSGPPSSQNIVSKPPSKSAATVHFCSVADSRLETG